MSDFSLEADLLAAALQPLPIAVLTTDVHGIVRSVNAALTSLIGYTAEEMVGQPVTWLPFGTAERSLSDIIQQALESHEPWRGEWVYRQRNGNPFTAEQTVASIKNPSGEIVSVVVTIQDVTGRKQVEKELRQAGPKNHPPNMSTKYQVVPSGGRIHRVSASQLCACDDFRQPVHTGALCLDVVEPEGVDSFAIEAQNDFERFFNLIPDLACIVSTDGYFKKVNPAWETTLGYTREEVLRTPMLELIHPDDRERSLNEVAKQSREYRTKHFVNRYRCKDGSYRIFDWRTTFNRDDSTRFGIAKDITEQRLWEESLRESEERFRIMADSCPTIIWVTDAAGMTRLANRVCREFFGAAFEQANRELSRSLIHPDDHSEYIGKFLLAVRERAPFRAEARVRRSDGEWRWIASYAEPRLSPSGEFLGHVGISPDITDRKQGEEALQKAKDAAEAANRSKSEFLANMSHEIRTPMNGVLGLTELALDTDLTAEQRSYLVDVKNSAGSLLRILNDILDFSKIEAGKLEFEAIEFDLRQTLEDMLKVLGVRAAAKTLALACDLHPAVPSRLLGDPGRLRQVLINLTGNAIKFTERGEVAIRVERLSETAHEVELHFSIKDTGIGIPLNKQQHVFSAFSQADSSLTRTFGGTGLGLTISSQLVEMMGGRIWLESEEGIGSTFHFTVRLGIARACSSTTTSEPRSSGSDIHEFPQLGSNAETQSEDAGQWRDVQEDPSLRLLVVEDNPVNGLVARRLLEKQNHAVMTASNGREALDIMEKEKFDCVLMDLQMPVLDGFETTAAIRNKERISGGHLPIIALTAHAIAGDLERCLAAGMDGYLTKPIDVKEVFATIERVLRARNNVRLLQH